jgi:tetraacyldisaccharide 4'-kinase
VNFLAPFGSLYGWIIDLRNWIYDRGWLGSYDLSARTISIGNITTGGTGKTPLVALVAELLADSGEKVCILTRGYGRENASARVLVSNGESVLVDAKTGGDEPVELAHKLLGKAIVIADPDRVAAAKWAKENFGVTAFVLDDGFQHRRAKRDLDIVCVDATDPFGNRLALPAGRLREPLSNLKRADAIILTRANLAKDIDDLRSEISNLRSEISDLKFPIFMAKNRIARFVRLQDFHGRPANPINEVGRAFAFCGLGNPQNFFDQLIQESVKVAGTKAFTDHHKYDGKDVETIESAARKIGADCLVTTAKDAVKLSDLKFEVPCYVAIAETVIDDAEAFRKLIISS